MGFFKRTLDDILNHIERVMLSSKIDEEERKKRLAELDIEAKMAIASSRQNAMIYNQLKNRIPSVPERRTKTIIDSRGNRKLNKYSFSQKEQYEILDRRAKVAGGEKWEVVYGKQSVTDE